MSLAAGAEHIETLAALEGDRWRDCWRTRVQHHTPTIRFHRPTGTLPVSVTGHHCALDCAHCGGHYLQHMRPLDDALANRGNDGAICSYLISGGCDRRGRIPWPGHVDAVRRLGEGHRLNVHVGLPTADDLRLVGPLADVISLDIVGDRRTAHAVYGLQADLSDYMRAYDTAREYTVVVPHLTLGLHGGRFLGEQRALEALAHREPAYLVLLVLIPTPGTRFANCPPPDLCETTETMARARLLLPTTEIYLGCMRPPGRYRQVLDEAAVRIGFNGIVNPCRGAQSAADELGLVAEWSQECCAMDACP